MLNKIKELTSEINAFTAETLEQVEQFRIKHLSKKGTIALLFEDFKNVSVEQKKEIGKALNELKTAALNKINTLKEQLCDSDKGKSGLDLTLPGDPMHLGTRHPLAIVRNEILSIFDKLGFTISEGPEIEDDWHNFSALNFPEEHPARDMQDTFYLSPEFLLRTQTSAGQIHVMENKKPPIKILSPGRVFRSDDDATHSPMFHQMEGLVVDKGITLSDLKGMLDLFVKKIYGEGTVTRLRPSYFPFTEPSVEVDCSCFECGGKGCNLCKGTGWIEILGAGVVNKKVLENCGIDSEEYSGFAFGIGLERTAMLKYGINNIKMLFGSDLRVLKQINEK